MNACTSDVCQQGRIKCPCSHACQVPDEDCFERDISSAIVYGAVLLCVLGVIAAIVWR